MTYQDAKPGEACTNGPDMEEWTCPNCYESHFEEVTECVKCGAKLLCTWETQQVARCAIADPDEHEEA